FALAGMVFAVRGGAGREGGGPGALMPRVVLPPHAPGMRIGLFGGTFDPPHQAHLGACLLAMKRLRLDRVWWLVTPGNPLKDTRNLAPLAQRIAAARALTHHPRIDVSGVEAEMRTRYTYDTVRWLTSRCPGVSVWSGSWAQTTGAASTAGRAGAALPRVCRGASPTAWVGASMRRPGRPARRSTAFACPSARRRRCPTVRRPPGCSCTVSSPPCHRRRCALRAK